MTGVRALEPDIDSADSLTADGGILTFPPLRRTDRRALAASCERTDDTGRPLTPVGVEPDPTLRRLNAAQP